MPWGSPSATEEIRRLSARLRQRDDPLVYARLAELLCDQGRVFEARSLCEQAIARYPGYGRARAVMARVAEAEGDLGRAEAELRMVLRSEPQNRVCRVTLARILIERGGLAEARQHLEHALFLSPGDSVARELLAQTNAAPALPRTAESVPVEGAPTASGPPSSLLEQALDLLAGTEGVLAVVLVDRSGLLVDSRCTENEDAEAASAMAHETWTLARNYMVRMRLGMLRLVTLHAGGRMFVLAPCNVGLLVVAAEPAARAGLLHMRAEASRNLLVNA